MTYEFNNYNNNNSNETQTTESEKPPINQEKTSAHNIGIKHGSGTNLRKQQKHSLLVNISIILAILIIINLISIYVFHRIDFSRGKIYSLSQSSKETVREIDDRLLIRAYITRDLPAQLADANRYTRDILAEYQAYSRGSIRFEFIDPSEDSRKQNEAQQNGINPVSMRVLEQDRFEVREIYMGLVFFYQGEMATIPFIQDTRGLEYDITKNIKKLTDIGRRSIGFFSPSNTAPTQPPREGIGAQPITFNQTYGMLEQHYNVTQLDLMEEVPAHLDLIIVAGIRDSLHIEELYHLDQFLMGGGNLLLFQNRIDSSLRTMQAEPINSNMLTLLNHYGINIKDNLVTDAECGMLQVQRQQGIFSFATPIEYPLLPVINNVNQDHIIVKNLENIQMLFASEIDEPSEDASLVMTPLLLTSRNSGEVTMPELDISIERFQRERNLRRLLTSSPKLVAAHFKGDMESYYLDIFPEEDDPLASNFNFRTSDAEILLVADSDFVQDEAGATAEPNLTFVLNAVDYLLGDTALIEIRARETVFKPLREINAAARRTVRWTNILLPSFLLIFVGIINWRNQIKRRRVIRSIYEQKQ